MLFYPGNTPSERNSDASAAAIDHFILLPQGLMRHTGVRQQNVLIGLGDGAP